MRQRDRPGKKSLFASAGVHLVAVLAAWTAQASTPKPLDFVTYQIEIVSPPPAQEAEVIQPAAEEDLVIETPDPTRPEPEPEPPPVVEEDPVREEERPEATPTPPPPDPEPVEAATPDPGEEPSSEEINVRMEGLIRDFPAYYGNIINQMNRCMRFSGPGGLKTSVRFTINLDGSVNGRRIDFVSRSGNAGFDFAVMEAVECAGNGRFGPLPDELGFDRLPIIFELTSSRRAPAPPRNTQPMSGMSGRFE
jgi:outer membrane biosynthesis protein TonB